MQADPYALRYAASRFSAGGQEFRSLASRLLRRKTDLVSNSWKGSASQSFDSQVERQVAWLKKNCDVLEQAASVLNQLASRMERVLELRRQAEQCEMAIWEYSGDSMDDLHHAQNLRRQATHYRNQAEWEAQQADSTASGQLQRIMSMIPNGMNLAGQGRGSIDDLDGIPESIKSYYRRHPELVEDESASEVSDAMSWASVKRADETAIQQDGETKSHLLALLKNLTKRERMGYWDESLDQEVFDQDYGDMSTDELKAQVFARLLKQQSSNYVDDIAVINESISTGVDFIPVVGNLKSLVEAISGKDYITSQDLSWLERGFALAGVFVGGLGKTAGKVVVKGTAMEVADQVAKHADSPVVENVVEGAGSLDRILEKIDIKKISSDNVSVIIKSSPDLGNELIERIALDFGSSIKTNPLRQEYENAVQELAELGRQLQADGLSDEVVARQLHQARRDLGIKYKDLTPQLLKEYIYDVNIGRYQDPLGPTVEFLIEVKGKSWDEIIDSATRPNPDVNTLLGGFKKWLRVKNGL